MSHLEIAKNVLLFESEQIKKAMDKLNEQFNHSVESVMQSKGKLVVCGIGKSFKQNSETRSRIAVFKYLLSIIFCCGEEALIQTKNVIEMMVCSRKE